MTKPERDVLMGVIGAPHGVRGQLRVKAYTGDPLALGEYGPLHDKHGNTYEITDIRPARSVVVVTFRQVRGREAAERLNGTELYVARSRLPAAGLEEDEFYIDDLVGLQAVDGEGAPLGRVVAMHNFGAGDMIELRHGDGHAAFYPFTRAVVPEIDFAAGRLVLVPPGEIVAAPDGGEEP